MTQPPYIRADGRGALALRPIQFITPCNDYAEGSCLIHMGRTQVMCTVSVEEKVPKHVKEGGWLTAEYAMLPRATHTRGGRDRAPAAPNSRASEIQRLIGRSLRGMMDLSKLGNRTFTVDCDVLQADGGTRCAAINGGVVAIRMAVAQLMQQGKILDNPIKSTVGAVSVVWREGVIGLDPDYLEDSRCDMDMNVVLNEKGGVIEVQASAEDAAPSAATLQKMMAVAEQGIAEVLAKMPPMNLPIKG